MASQAPVTTTPDTMITVKVNIDGTVRRFKLPLRDVGVNTFESKVRFPLLDYMATHLNTALIVSFVDPRGSEHSRGCRCSH
jgi:hypothetical protein